MGISDCGRGTGFGRPFGPPPTISPIFLRDGQVADAGVALDEAGEGVKARSGLDRDKLDGNFAEVEVGRGGAPVILVGLDPVPGGRVRKFAADARDEDEDNGFKTRPGLDRDKPDEPAASVEAGRVGVPEQMAENAATSGP